MIHLCGPRCDFCGLPATKVCDKRGCGGEVCDDHSVSVGVWLSHFAIDEVPADAETVDFCWLCYEPGIHRRPPPLEPYPGHRVLFDDLEFRPKCSHVSTLRERIPQIADGRRVPPRTRRCRKPAELFRGAWFCRRHVSGDT
jgi:hypothetical protein